MLLFIKGRYLESILSRRKTATVRLWRSSRLAPGSPLTFAAGRTFVRARVVSVTETTLDALSDADIHADGFDARADFLRAIQTHYPDAALDAPCVVLRFDLLAE